TPWSGRPPLFFECSPEVVREEAGSWARLFVVDRDARRLRAVREQLVHAGKDRAALFFHGRFADFRRDLQTVAGLVILGGEGGPLSPGDAVELGALVDPGTPVLLLPASGEETLEALCRTGLFAIPEKTGGGPVRRVHSTELCSAVGVPLPESAFNEVKRRLDERYFLLEELGGGPYTPVAAETRPAREALLDLLRREGRGWPRRPAVLPSPLETLPGRRPWPRISVVTPSFNQGAYIEETILSVLNQGYPSVEHIVVDGGSDDGTLAVLDKYRRRLAHVISEPDRGQAHAINKGMALATGEILTWLNSDDMLAPGALHAAAFAFFTSGADMVAGLCGIYENGRLTGYHLTGAEDGPLPLEELLDLEGSWTAGRFFYQPEVMFTRELWERAGAHVAEHLRYSMDYELWLRFAEAGARLHVVGRPLAWFRVHPEQKTAKPEAYQAELRQVRRAFGTAGASRKPASGKLRHGLRIVMVNDVGYAYGAGIAHQRIAQALSGAGHDLHAVMLRDDSEGLPGSSGGLERAVKYVAECKPDLLIAGNLHRASATALLYGRLARVAPVHAVLHDFWPVTGRCAYPM
ncbi:MAG TPA: glycosyltransferase, partial [Bryobacterales bacterium]|nr:glycosyltransferase [Bryobacterales bacterium]